MAEIAAAFIEPAIEVVKWIGAPIMRQFNYLCCFTTNIATLKHEARALDDATKGLQRRVDGERNNAQVIVPEVDTWLTTSKEIMDEMNGISNEATNVGSGCFKLRDHFSLSKRAKKTTDRMIELRSRCKFNIIAHPGPPAASQAVLLGTTYEFQSRKQIEEDIMTSLREGEMNMIGICGMGGLGKTTMAKMIMNRALKEHLFEEVAMVVVSQPVDKLKIQVEIGETLGLKNLKEEASMANRVQMLHARLTEGTKRILLVLDDIWESLKVEDIGIPHYCKGCTILLTSRNHHVLSAMDVKVFGMEVLSKEDAWLLFKGRAGTCVDDSHLNSMAKEVVEECKGLPIALTTVGAALKDEKNKGIWKDAIRQLRKANPTDIPDFIKEVYNPLKVSYDKLESKEAKSIFLLCCLFPEDDHIYVEDLTYFCMGLDIFEGGIRNIEEARNRMYALSKMLKSRSLLLDSYSRDYYVRMHDVVRDVCIFIAKEEGYIGHKDCTWISSFQGIVERRIKLPTSLRLLFLNGKSKLEEEIRFDNTFLEGITDLHVLCIKSYSSLTSLPHTTELKNLNSLMLHSCQKLETLSVVGELVNLEILICRDCDSIKEVPPEMKGLDRLKLFDVTGCQNLERIAPGIISSLVGLEEMKMLKSFKKWEASDSKQRENAELRELESLINLRCLEIEIEDAALVAEKMRFSSNLDRFQIRIPPSSSSPHGFDSYPCDKKMSLEWEGGSCVGDWIGMQLIRDTECLQLKGNGANNVEWAKSENIRWLKLGECKTMKNIGRYGGATVFPHMEFLKLFSLPELEEILDGPISSDSFQNLKELSLYNLPALKQFWKRSSGSVFSNLSSIEISSCPRIRNLGRLSIAGKDCLPQLQTLSIEICEMMEQVFLWNEEEDQNINNSESTITKMFPQLKQVDLFELPNLTTFCEGIEGIEFPLLTEMSIKYCPKMTSMVSSNENKSGGSSNADIDDGHSLHLFCQPQKVSFGNLKKLRTHRNPFSCGHIIDASLFIGLKKLDISKCEGTMSLFSSSIARNLVSLKALKISDCDELVQMIKDDEEEKAASGGQRTILLFPKLQELELEDLPKLVSICEWKCDVELPSLNEVEIHRCPNMKYFMLGFLAAPNLQVFKTDLDNYLEVSFPSVKQLTIKWNENPLHCYKNIHVSLFNRLEVLDIWWYKGSTSLFTSSTAENLVSLRELSIGGCDDMVKVIEDEEEKEREEEKVVISGAAQRTTLLFPKLQKLQLWDLPKLVSFCEWEFDVEFPSLREVEISECPHMKHFTLGLLTTPNLEVVRINKKYFGGVKDLNDAVQQQFEKKQHEEKEAGAEVQEIEEELNS